MTEIYLVGNTASLNQAEIENMTAVERIVRVSKSYAVLGRHLNDSRSYGFNYNGVRFDQDSLHVFAGLGAVDTPAHVDAMMSTQTHARLH